MIEWCRDHPTVCIIIISLILTVFLFYRSSISADLKYTEKIVNSPSVLANPNVATSLARSAEDIARNNVGETIRDQQLEAYMLSKQLSYPA